MMVLLDYGKAGMTNSRRRERRPKALLSGAAAHSAAAERLAAARAEALFTSALSAECHLDRDQVATAIGDAVRRLSGTRGCACEVAAEYGDHPDVAAPRMRWARRVVSEMFPQRSPAGRCGAA